MHEDEAQYGRDQQELTEAHHRAALEVEAAAHLALCSLRRITDLEAMHHTPFSDRVQDILSSIDKARNELGVNHAV